MAYQKLLVAIDQSMIKDGEEVNKIKEGRGSLLLTFQEVVTVKCWKLNVAL